MPFITSERPINDERFFIEDIQAPLSDVLIATAKRSFKFSPLNSIERSLEFEAAGRAADPTVAGTHPLIRRGRSDVINENLDRNPGRTLQPDEATELGKDLGLRFDKPVTERQFEILAERKQEERRLNSIIARAPSGFAPTVAQVVTDIAVQAIDPINVASAFIPVLREARFAKIAERAGVSTARVTRGALEGGVGAAAVEPIILLAATQEQADYTATDSMLNIAFGTVIGSGLHFAGGKIGDAVERAAARRQARLEGLVPAEDRVPADRSPEPPEGSNGHRAEALDIESRERIAQASVKAAQSDQIPPVDRLYELIAPSDVLETFTPRMVEVSTTVTPEEFEAAISAPQIRGALTGHVRGLLRRANKGTAVPRDQEIEKLFELMAELREELADVSLRTPDNIRKLRAIQKNQPNAESVTKSAFFDPERGELFVAKNANLIDAVRAVEHATDLLKGKTDTASTTTFRFAPDDTEGRFLHRQIVNAAEAVKRNREPEAVDGQDFVRRTVDETESVTADTAASEAATVRSAELNARTIDQDTEEAQLALTETIDGIRASNPDLAGELDEIAAAFETNVENIDAREKVVDQLTAYADCIAR